MSEPTATLISGLERLSLTNLVGMTVSNVRDEYEDVVNIPDNAAAYVNGVPVDGNYVIKANDQVTFSRPTGSKG